MDADPPAMGFRQAPPTSPMTLSRYLLPVLILAFSPSGASKPKPKKETPSQQLLLRLNGTWRDLDGYGLVAVIRRNAGTGGTLRMWTGGELNDWSSYTVVGPDKIRVEKTSTTYRIKFTKRGMDWTIPGEKQVRHFQRLHRLPGEKESSKQ